MRSINSHLYLQVIHRDPMKFFERRLDTFDLLTTVRDFPIFANLQVNQEHSMPGMNFQRLQACEFCPFQIQEARICDKEFLSKLG